MSGDGDEPWLQPGDTERPVVNITVAIIIAREIIEMVFFLGTHFGAIWKNDRLTAEQKTHYFKGMIPACVLGITVGAIVAVSIAFGVASALHTAANVGYGIALGEGFSKLIAAFFVGNLFMKMPKWFAVSNFREVVYEEIRDDDVDQDKPYNVYIKDHGNNPPTPSRFELSLSLGWNLSREIAEAGTLTALVVLLQPSAMNVLGESVAVGLTIAILLAIIFTIGAKYIHAKGFCIVGTFMVGLLLVGLVSGTVAEFEEAYAIQNHQMSTMAWLVTNRAGVAILNSLAFMGLRAGVSSLHLLTFITTAVVGSLLQFVHNYIGLPLIPYSVVHPVTKCARQSHEGLAVCCCWCGKRRST